MKSGDFAKLLRAAADLTGARVLASAAPAFESKPAATVAAAAKIIGGDPSSAVWADPAGLTRSLAALRPLVQIVGKTAVKDVDAVIALCQGGPKAAPAPRAPRSGGTKPKKPAAAPSAVDDYVRDLTASLSSQPAFSNVYARLESDASLGVAEYKAIAKAFARVSAKSKADAMKRILARHQSVMGFDAKARATDGRSAA